MEARIKLRQQKLRITFLGYVLVLIFFGIVQVISIIFFTQGFLLSREVPETIASCDDAKLCMEPVIDKTIFLVIDALRFDFVIPVKGSEKHYHNNFPILYDMAQNHPQKATLLKFIADPPTTTFPRLKGLTTGSLPTFLDAGSNFDGDEITEDNWLLQLYNHNKTIAFMGDDTWQALFKKYVDPDLNFPYPSLNVWDIHTVDNGVLKHLYPLINNDKRWDLIIGHFLGVDHIGHRFGPNHYSMKDKLHQMNDNIRKVMDEMDDKTMLIVIGDHGMDSTGNHGGDSRDEQETTLFMYTKSNTFNFNARPKHEYNISNLGANYRSVNQVDLVSTISLLMGVPIPYNNLGFPIDEAFDTASLASASFKTAQQIYRFRQSSNVLKTNQELNQQYEHFITNYNQFASNKKYQNQLIQEAKDFQYSSLEHCKALWTRFDLKFIVLGILLLLFSFLFILSYSRSIPSVRVSTMSFEFIGSVIAMSLLGIVLSISIYIVLMPHELTLKHCIGAGVGLGMIIGFWAPIMDRFSVQWLIHQIYDFFIYSFNIWSFLGLTFIILHCLIFASNSYVIWEDKLSHFFILTFGISVFLAILFSSRLSSHQKILGLIHSVTFIVVSRLVSMINLCREEQGGLCKPTFEITWVSIVGLFGVAFLLPSMIKAFYKLSNSYTSAAPLWIGSGTKFLLILNAFNWKFEYIENNAHMLKLFNTPIVLNLLKSLKIGISRIVLIICLGVANYGWTRGPLCVKIDVSKPRPPPITRITSPEPDGADDIAVEAKPTATILGFDNVYGTSYFLLVINFTIGIMLVSKPLGAISIAGLLVQILSLLEIIDLLHLRKNLVSPIILLLLGYLHFFSTGHQATIPSIHWEVGFMTNETIIFPFTHLNILLNTFGSFIIVCLSAPLITLWKIPPSSKHITLLSQIITVTTTILTYQTLLSVSSFIFTAHFRRHLMVWKIFAPRFMLNGLLLVLINVVMVVLTLWFGTRRILTQVNRIFSK